MQREIPAHMVILPPQIHADNQTAINNFVDDLEFLKSVGWEAVAEVLGKHEAAMHERPDLIVKPEDLRFEVKLPEEKAPDCNPYLKPDDANYLHAFADLQGNFAGNFFRLASGVSEVIHDCGIRIGGAYHTASHNHRVAHTASWFCQHMTDERVQAMRILAYGLGQCHDVFYSFTKVGDEQKSADWYIAAHARFLETLTSQQQKIFKALARIGIVSGTVLAVFLDKDKQIWMLPLWQFYLLCFPEAAHNPDLQPYFALCMALGDGDVHVSLCRELANQTPMPPPELSKVGSELETIIEAVYREKVTEGYHIPTFGYIVLTKLAQSGRYVTETPVERLLDGVKQKIQVPIQKALAWFLRTGEFRNEHGEVVELDELLTDQNLKDLWEQNPPAKGILGGETWFAEMQLKTLRAESSDQAEAKMESGGLDWSGVRQITAQRDYSMEIESWGWQLAIYAKIVAIYEAWKHKVDTGEDASEERSKLVSITRGLFENARRLKGNMADPRHAVYFAEHGACLQEPRHTPLPPPSVVSERDVRAELPEYEVTPRDCRRSCAHFFRGIFSRSPRSRTTSTKEKRVHPSPLDGEETKEAAGMAAESTQRNGRS